MEFWRQFTSKMQVGYCWSLGKGRAERKTARNHCGILQKKVALVFMVKA